MWTNPAAEHLMSDQVGHFVSHGLLEKVLAIFLIQLGVESQQVGVQVRNTGFLSMQFETDLWPLEALVEKSFGLLVTGFDSSV